MSIHYVKVLTSPSFSIDTDFKVTWWMDPCCVHMQTHSPPVNQVAEKIVNLNLIRKNAHELRKVSS